MDRQAQFYELREMGLSPTWLRIAETIGTEQFLSVWRILDESNRDLHRGRREKVRVWVPLYATYLRHRRNRYIKALAAEDLRPLDIQQRVYRELCERISLRHIVRIIAGG